MLLYFAQVHPRNASAVIMFWPRSKKNSSGDVGGLNPEKKGTDVEENATIGGIGEETEETSSFEGIYVDEEALDKNDETSETSYVIQTRSFTKILCTIIISLLFAVSIFGAGYGVNELVQHFGMSSAAIGYGLDEQTPVNPYPSTDAPSSAVVGAAETGNPGPIPESTSGPTPEPTVLKLIEEVTEKTEPAVDLEGGDAALAFSLDDEDAALDDPYSMSMGPDYLDDDDAAAATSKSSKSKPGKSKAGKKET